MWVMTSSVEPGLLRAIDDLAEHGVGGVAGLFLVLLRDGAHEVFGLVAADEVDGGAAEAAAGEARAVTGWARAREVYEQIEFGRAVVKEVA